MLWVAIVNCGYQFFLEKIVLIYPTLSLPATTAA
jgi:hypothetical protein